MWPEGLIYYKFEKGFTHDEKVIIVEQMDHIKAHLIPGCLRFEEIEEAFGEPKKWTSGYLEFNKTGDSCLADIGNRDVDKGRPSRVCLPDKAKCFDLDGTRVLHEIGHILGAAHEHSRLDRDLFVEIIGENIDEGAKDQFNKKSDSEFIETNNTPYDFDSIMHYSDDRGLKESSVGRKCIKVAEPFAEFAESIAKQERLLSVTDIVEISYNYGCAVRPDFKAQYIQYFKKITTLLIKSIIKCRKSGGSYDECCKAKDASKVAKKYFEDYSDEVEDDVRYEKDFEDLDELHSKLIEKCP
eukprot:TRINITY_DN9289_c1_g1_i2.p1 TRINITY_DN9289_c1_g1~~TRINITY_DN9289_c1_g1_i2.p1  ORF type:complete len:332 (+),score=60.58 TRINITY_DN9289_c1_g1_i2:105-998(+)